MINLINTDNIKSPNITCSNKVDINNDPIGLGIDQLTEYYLNKIRYSSIESIVSGIKITNHMFIDLSESDYMNIILDTMKSNSYKNILGDHYTTESIFDNSKFHTSIDYDDNTPVYKVGNLMGVSVYKYLSNKFNGTLFLMNDDISIEMEEGFDKNSMMINSKYKVKYPTEVLAIFTKHFNRDYCEESLIFNRDNAINKILE